MLLKKPQHPDLDGACDVTLGMKIQQVPVLLLVMGGWDQGPPGHRSLCWKAEW